MADPCRDAYGDRQILMRLGIEDTTPKPWAAGCEIGVVRPAGQEAVLRLVKRGLVNFHMGEGKDAGVMLVRAAASGVAPPYPRGVA